MKPREPRLNVMINARISDGARWSDALILNMSSRGLLVRSDSSPGRGSYLELRRGPHLIVARVIWSKSDRFGVQTQDPVPTAALVRDPDGPAMPQGLAGTKVQDRRTSLRVAQDRHERSREQGRAVEFGAMAFACGMVAILVAAMIADVVAAPIQAVQTALAAK